MKYASVKFQTGPQEYCYRTDLELKKGDVCIVKSKNGYGIVQVVNPNETNENKTKLATAWVVMQVDLKTPMKRIRAYES